MKVTFEIDPGFSKFEVTPEEIVSALRNTQIDYTSRNSNYYRAHEERKKIREYLASANIKVEIQPELDMTAIEAYKILDIESLKLLCLHFDMFELSHISLKWTHEALVEFMERKIYIRPKDAPRYLRELKKRAAEKR